MNDLAKELQVKITEHDPKDVDELILDDLFEGVSSFSDQNKKDLEKYFNLIHLSLNGLGLENLKNFPKLPSLQILQLRQNKLNGKDLNIIAELYPELYKLKIGENPIENLDVFKALAGTQIKKLELSETAAAKSKDYKANLFKMLKNVEVIDNTREDGEEVSSSVYDEDEGEEIDDEDVEGEEFDDGEDGEDFDDDEEEEGDGDDE